VFLVAPTEPAELRRLGVVSGVPERHGCDVVWTASSGGFAGVQRKTLGDLWASVRDGRLSREVAAMAGADLALTVLVIEGRLRWSASGVLATGGGAPLSRDQLRGLVLSLQRRGVVVLHTDDVGDTVGAIGHVRRWFDKATHDSLDLRPSAPAPPGTRAWGVHLLQSFPLVGPTVAGNVVDHFGGVPLAWTRTLDELAGVRGVGTKRAAALWTALSAQCERAPSLPA
jgi:ERCC4-type nuclease